MSRGNGPVFIPSHHLGSELKGFKFEAGEGIQQEDQADAEWRQPWACGQCGKAGAILFWRSEARDVQGIYERIDRNHHATSPHCPNRRRNVAPPVLTGRWKDATGALRSETVNP